MVSALCAAPVWGPAQQTGVHERERERESKAFPYRHGPTDTKVHAYVAVMDANDSRDDGIER